MKNLKNLLPLFALILGLSIVFTQSAFTSTTKSATTTYWYYTGPNNDEAEVLDHDNWSMVDPNDTCLETAQKPCRISVDADNQTAFESFLSTQDQSDIDALTEGRKF